MFKLIFLILILYAFFKVRGFMKRLGNTVNQSLSEMTADKVDDVMIKDPVCEVYFPKREGIHLHHQGQDLYFCSQACRDAYVRGEGNPT